MFQWNYILMYNYFMLLSVELHEVLSIIHIGELYNSNFMLLSVELREILGNCLIHILCYQWNYVKYYEMV